MPEVPLRSEAREAKAVERCIAVNTGTLLAHGAKGYPNGDNKVYLFVMIAAKVRLAMLKNVRSLEAV
jgi:hypothetical protein